MRRGDVVTVAAGGGFGGKPRPALVIQADAFLQLSTIVVALFTTTEGKPGMTRPRFRPTPENGLLATSHLMVDVLVTVRLQHVGGVLGRLTDAEIALADRALILFLGLAE